MAHIVKELIQFVQLAVTKSGLISDFERYIAPSNTVISFLFFPSNTIMVFISG